jgi:hypothetical protein
MTSGVLGAAGMVGLCFRDPGECGEIVFKSRTRDSARRDTVTGDCLSAALCPPFTV